jgi:hypothetical protein
MIPFSVTSGGDRSGTALNNDRADVVGDWHLDNSIRSKNDWIAKFFNTAAFGPNKVGTFGNAGRNILRGPVRQSLDFGLLKSFPLKEAKRLQFRAETFNVMNHANFGNPNGNQSAGNFGRITSASTPRIMQLALKLIF